MNTTFNLTRAELDYLRNALRSHLNVARKNARHPMPEYAEPWQAELAAGEAIERKLDAESERLRMAWEMLAFKVGQ